MSQQLRGSHEDSEKLAHLLLFLTSRSLWDLQCCPNLSPTHFWGTRGNSESHILTLSYCAPWCSLITEPWVRHVVTLREPLWEEPCFIVQCAASWDLKNVPGVQRSWTPSNSGAVQISSGKRMTKDLLALTTFSSPCDLLWVEFWIFWTNLLMWYEGWKFVFFACGYLIVPSYLLKILSFLYWAASATLSCIPGLPCGCCSQLFCPPDHISPDPTLPWSV